MILGTSKFCFIFIFYLDAPEFTANPKKADAAEAHTKPDERNTKCLSAHYAATAAETFLTAYSKIQTAAPIKIKRKTRTS